MKINDPLRIGTRGSTLAMWQARYVAEKLKASGIDTTLVIIKTTGDMVQDRFLHEIGGKGLFIRELESALLRKEIDIAVHSFKDMPVNIPDDFVICATLKRHSPQDVIVRNSHGRLKDLPPVLPADNIGHLFNSARIGSSSLRRASYFRRYFPGVVIHPLRGNVDTRLRKLQTENLDAIVLAYASLERLQLTSRFQLTLLDPIWMIPCAAQGALAVETLSENQHARTLREILNCEKTFYETSVERAILKKLGGDCNMPFGCYAYTGSDADALSTHTIVLDHNGNSVETCQNFQCSTDPKSIAESVVDELLQKGLQTILSNLSGKGLL